MKIKILKPLSAVPPVGEVGDVIDIHPDRAQRLIAVRAAVAVDESDEGRSRRRYQRRDLSAS